MTMSLLHVLKEPVSIVRETHDSTYKLLESVVHMRLKVPGVCQRWLCSGLLSLDVFEGKGLTL